MNAVESPQLEFAMEISVEVGAMISTFADKFGEGRTVPILGGTVSGPEIRGIVLPGGADWQFVDHDGIVHLDARYAIECGDSTRIEVRNRGIRHGSPAVMSRLQAGEFVAPDEYYFRTSPVFTAPEGKFGWLKRSIFVASAERSARAVVIRVWRVA